MNLRLVFLVRCCTLFPKEYHIHIAIFRPRHIAFVKRCYELKMAQRAIDIIDSGQIENLYKVDVKEEIIWTNNVYVEINTDIVCNFWVKSGLLLVSA